MRSPTRIRSELPDCPAVLLVDALVEAVLPVDAGVERPQENVFTLDDSPGHEVVLVYEIAVPDVLYKAHGEVVDTVRVDETDPELFDELPVTESYWWL